MPPFRLAHLSDPHLPPPAGSEGGLEPKRLLSRFAWRRKRRRHDPAILAAIVADVQAARPDHVAITGDLTNFSTAAELAAARRWLEALGPADRVTVSPGNHDALVGAPDNDRFAAWEPWLGDEGGVAFPKIRRRGPVALINLCSATPTAFHLAQGALGREQLEPLDGLLREAREAGLFRVLLIHHPPGPGVVSARKSLRAPERLLAILEEAGVELVLHGHAHEATVATVQGPRGAIPVLGVPPASGAGGHGERARWHEIAVAGGAGAWDVQVTARGLDAEGQAGELGRYRLAS